MLIRTAITASVQASEAIPALAAGLQIAEHGPPDFLTLHASSACDIEGLRSAAVAGLAGRHLHGGTSCLGVMGNAGSTVMGQGGLGAFAIWDAGGDYGVGSADLGEDARAAAAAAVRDALADAGRVGEAPDLIWLTAAPGCEELVIAGICDVVGQDACIVGGSSADDAVEGQWAQFESRVCHRNGLVVSVLFPSQPISLAFQNGYAPAGPSGVVSKAEGRRLMAIDGRPAAEVYEGWTGELLPAAEDAPVSILAETSLAPLGRIVGEVASVPTFLLAHPSERLPDGSFEMFSAVAPGEHVWLMQGSAETLAARAGRVVRQAAEFRPAPERPVAGALVIFCGGCMLSIRDRMESVAKDIDAAMDGMPYLGIFTFGEQVMPANGRPQHANLMISCCLFQR